METTLQIDLEAENKFILKQYRILLRSLKNHVTKQDKKNVRLAFDLLKQKRLGF